MVYIFHFDPPLKHARHYIGTTDDLEQRIHDHLYTTEGSPFVKACIENGSSIYLAKEMEGGRKKERKLKNYKKTSQLCPICRGEHEGILIEVDMVLFNKQIWRERYYERSESNPGS